VAAAERGISFRKGPATPRRQMPEILENADEKLSPAPRRLLDFFVAGVERPAVADREPEHARST